MSRLVCAGSVLLWGGAAAAQEADWAVVRDLAILQSLHQQACASDKAASCATVQEIEVHGPLLLQAIAGCRAGEAEACALRDAYAASVRQSVPPFVSDWYIEHERCLNPDAPNCESHGIRHEDFMNSLRED